MGEVIHMSFVPQVDGFVAGLPTGSIVEAIAVCESFGDAPRVLEVACVWSGKVVWRLSRRRERKLA